MPTDSYKTNGGIVVRREVQTLSYPFDLPALAKRLDERRGVLLSSSFEYPGRYTRWDKGFFDPPIMVAARGRSFSIEALNPRGELLMGPIARELQQLTAVASLNLGRMVVEGTLCEAENRFAEELRSRQASIFSVLRSLVDLFRSPHDPHLGLYGAFGYDLVFQFEPMEHRLQRALDQRDLVLFLPDDLTIVDHMRQSTTRIRYDFVVDSRSTMQLPGTTEPAPYRSSPQNITPLKSDHADGSYETMVTNARAAFARGDLFEVVLGQLFSVGCVQTPSEVFERLRISNPAPYGALFNLGGGEFLVSASPEMYVRVEGKRVETCPISGTVRRGANAIEDAQRIRELLASVKDEAELTMCTDVDRNDKSRICEAGSVRVIGRRQIEVYSRLIHTVDHVEGMLRPEFDALDAFLSHAWAVTVTGAPKRGAMGFIEKQEKSARRWYGGAMGAVTFDGNMNTGLTLRTIRMKDGRAEVRAGATLLHDSDPKSEEAETRLKAAALLAALSAVEATVPPEIRATSKSGAGKRVVLVDHEDSFVHTLAGYFRNAGAEVVTLRAGLARARLEAGEQADLIVLSPGPCRPVDFAMSQTIDLAMHRQLPVFGVCLGLQGLVEYFGGKLDLLTVPVHGKPSEIQVIGGRLFAGLPTRFTAGRYHSIYARDVTIPPALVVTARTADGIVMAVEHTSLPLAAVQFHPESIMTPAAIGARLIENSLAKLCRQNPPKLALNHKTIHGDEL